MGFLPSPQAPPYMGQRDRDLSLQPRFLLPFCPCHSWHVSQWPPTPSSRTGCTASGPHPPLPLLHMLLHSGDTSWVQLAGPRSQCVLLGAGVLGQLHTGFENRTPPQSRKKVEWQHWVRQRLSRHLGSQGEPDILTFGQLTCPIPTLKLTRTNKSPQNVSFAQNQHFLVWELLCQWLLCFSTISNSELNLMSFCSSITSTAHQAQRESCTTDSSDATQNISAQQGFRRSSGNKWLYCLFFLLWQIPSQSATSLC